MENKRIISKGLSVLLSSFQKPMLLHRFFVIAHKMYPTNEILYKRPPIQAFKNQKVCTNWLISNSNLHIWYDAADLMDSPTKWGPVVWKLLFLMAKRNHVGSNGQSLFLDLLSVLSNILPCATCNETFKRLLKRKEFLKMVKVQKYYPSGMKFITKHLRYEVSKHANK
jgi:hypothetical protein